MRRIKRNAVVFLVITILFFITYEYFLDAAKKHEVSKEQEAVEETSIVSNEKATPEATKEIVEAPTEVSLVMAGDILLHTDLLETGEKADGSYDFTPLFEQVKDTISQADLALVNQEVILGGSELGLSGYPAFNGPFEVGDALVKAGFNMILHGTNHALDKGKKGLLSCLDFWQGSYPEVEVLGIYDNEEDYASNCSYYEKEDLTIAILNYTYGTNGIDLPSNMPYAVSLLEEEKVEADLEKANKNADFVIVCPHWGTEYQLTPSSNQEKWAQIFLDNGVDLVIGTHPHVIEPVEWLERDDGSRMLVYYSIGNFANFTSGSGAGVANRAVGILAEVTISLNESEDAMITDYSAAPLVCHMAYGQGATTTYFLEDYTQELATENEMTQKDPAFSLAYCQELYDKVITISDEIR